MDFKDYYASLGLTKTASPADIKRAYRKLARQYHPDVNQGNKTAEAKFKEINEANEVLGDPEKRRKYDELGANWRAYDQQGGAEGAPGGWTPPAGGSSYRTMTPEEMQDMFGNADPFSDFFHTFFGGQSSGGQTSGRPSRGGRPVHGQDIEHEVDLTLDDVFHGTSRKVVISGDGADRPVEVRIPAGVNDGARVRAAGGGGSPGRGGTKGDLYLKVRVKAHPTFERRGADLYTRIEVPVTTAVLGGEVPVPTLAGSPLRLKVPELTRAGRVFRLRGHGMPVLRQPNERGDLYATVEILMPTSITDEERTHYEALKRLRESPA